MQLRRRGAGIRSLNSALETQGAELARLRAQLQASGEEVARLRSQILSMQSREGACTLCGSLCSECGRQLVGGSE